MMNCSSTHLTSDPTGVMLLTWQQPDSTATALNKFCSICTPNGVYTEFGIDPSFRLAGRVRLWEATDFSENMIVEARKKPRSSRLHFSVQDATALLYAPDSFDAVVISNALHIMPHPELALAEIKRVLKPGGILYAPTFVHGRGTGFRLRAWLLTLTGFKVYFKWTAEGFERFISEHNFQIRQTALLGGSLAPLCYLEASVQK